MHACIAFVLLSCYTSGLLRSGLRQFSQILRNLLLSCTPLMWNVTVWQPISTESTTHNVVPNDNNMFVRLYLCRFILTWAVVQGNGPCPASSSLLSPTEQMGQLEGMGVECRIMLLPRALERHVAWWLLCRNVFCACSRLLSEKFILALLSLLNRDITSLDNVCVSVWWGDVRWGSFWH